MDKVQKFVRKLGRREASRVLDAIARIRAGELEAFDVKKLKGSSDQYRVRLGRVRILFTKVDGHNVIADVQFRGDHTYLT